MELQKRIGRQRIFHIIDSYQLLGTPPDPLGQDRLEQLLNTHSLEVLEVAIANCLMKLWGRVPMPRGQAFLEVLTDHLKHQLPNQLTPHQFQQITGLAMIEAVLDPSVVIQ